MAIKLPYGLKDGTLVHINDVQEKGLKCECYCSSCNAKLVARKGSQKVHHFAHYNAPECKHAVQTALHIAAKDIIAQQLKFTIPGYSKYIDEESFFDDVDIFVDIPDPIVFFSEKALTVTNVYLEKKTNDFVPDIILEIGDKKLIVEIAVTHFIDKDKHQKILTHGISVIEIDLSSFKDNFELGLLEELVITGTKYKKWIFNKVAETNWKKWQVEFTKANEKEKEEYEREHKEMRRQYDESFQKEQKKRIEKEAFYLKNTKTVQTHSFTRTDIIANKVIEKTISHVSPCPEQKKFFHGESYANIDTHCIYCKYFRGYRNEKRNIVCLGSYYKNKPID